MRAPMLSAKQEPISRTRLVGVTVKAVLGKSTIVLNSILNCKNTP